MGGVEVSEVGGRVGITRIRRVADLARTDGGPVLAFHQTAGARRRSATYTGNANLLPERSIDEFWDAATGGTRLIITGVRLCRLRARERVWAMAVGPGKRMKHTNQRKKLTNTPHDVTGETDEDGEGRERIQMGGWRERSQINECSRRVSSD